MLCHSSTLQISIASFSSIFSGKSDFSDGEFCLVCWRVLGSVQAVRRLRLHCIPITPREARGSDHPSSGEGILVRSPEAVRFRRGLRAMPQYLPFPDPRHLFGPVRRLFSQFLLTFIWFSRKLRYIYIFSCVSQTAEIVRLRFDFSFPPVSRWPNRGTWFGLFIFVYRLKLLPKECNILA